MIVGGREGWDHKTSAQVNGLRGARSVPDPDREHHPRDFIRGLRSFGFCRAASQDSTYALAGTRRIAFPMTSSARSSALLKRMQALPMSSFLPVFAQDSRNRRASTEAGPPSSLAP